MQAAFADTEHKSITFHCHSATAVARQFDSVHESGYGRIQGL